MNSLAAGSIITEGKGVEDCIQNMEEVCRDWVYQVFARAWLWGNGGDIIYSTKWTLHLIIAHNKKRIRSSDFLSERYFLNNISVVHCNLCVIKEIILVHLMGNVTWLHIRAKTNKP